MTDVPRRSPREETPLLPERRAFARFEATGWRAQLPLAASTFIILALLALVITPVLVSWRLEALQTSSASTTGRAHALTDSLKTLFIDEILLLQHIRTGDTLSVTDYRTVRASQERLIAQLREIAPSISADATARVNAVAEFSARWHIVPDAVAARHISYEQAVSEMRRILADRDSMIVTEQRLDSDIDLIASIHRTHGVELLAMQRALSLGLGLLAVIATIMVAWFARRERRLAHALEASVAALELRRTELESVTESRNRLMRGFSHDVKNPIGAADGYLQLLADGVLGPVVEQQRVGIERARRSLAAALSLIGDLLELARTDVGHVRLTLVPTDIRTVAREAGEQYRAQAEAKGLVMRIDVDRDVPTILTDPVRVRQILGNLISNAVKYTATGNVAVRVGEEDDPELLGRLSISVADTGLGIADTQRHLLFKEFSRLAPAAGPGIGIGLAVSARIAEALGGSIAMRSESGRGSVFTLWLPTT